MAKIKPNQICPCGSESKYKKCCAPFIEGQAIDHPARLICTRFTAAISGKDEFLWNTYHSESPKRLNDNFKKFQHDQSLLKNMSYKKMVIADEKVGNDKSVFVVYFEIFDGDQEVSYVEEMTLKKLEDRWYYFDGLRRSVFELRINPEGIKVGELKTFFPWDKGLN